MNWSAITALMDDDAFVPDPPFHMNPDFTPDVGPPDPEPEPEPDPEIPDEPEDPEDPA